MRRTWISVSSTTPLGSTVPVMGAAAIGYGLAASGMWPSAVSRPEVASSPIQPAPGRNASAQACRSATSGVPSSGSWMR